MKMESDCPMSSPEPEAEESEEGMYSCNTCGVSFSSVIDHIQNYHNDQDQKLAGPGSKRYMRMNNMCDSVIRNLQQNDKSGPSHKVLIKEVLTKDGEMIKYYHCVFCNINVSSLGDFKTQPCKNYCLEKPVVEAFECEICCTVFPTNKARQIEAPRNSDFSEMRYLCATCEKMIPVDYRAIHEKSHLNEQNLLNCGICNKKFSSEEYLEMHMNAPLTKQDQSLRYNCLYCDRRFARPHEKVKHERIHTAHSVYNHHLLTHSDVRAYKCPYCPKAFKTSVQLAGHKNSHTKPFSCTHCNRPFASLYAVRVHTETHARQNNLKFSCSLCGASYARAFALKDHIKQHHKDDIMKTESV
ncbi:Zinc finger protein, partial [Operophtera brumata]